jgi:membrane associated rhomboid family serine protease
MSVPRHVFQLILRWPASLQWLVSSRRFTSFYHRRYRRALAFDHGRFAPHTLLTAAYVHGSDSHLYNNLVGYAIAALYTYALCLSVDERRWFRRTVSVQLLLLPILVNLVSYAVFQLPFPDADPVSQGFSGVVSGFVKFLLVALYVFVRRRHSREVGYAIGLSTLFLVLQLIDLRYAGRVRPSVTGLIALGGTLVVVPYLRDGIEIPTDRHVRLL